MNEKPIPFSSPMVKAILEGRKTQIRRIVKPQPNASGYWPTGDVSCDDCGDVYSKRARKCKCGTELMKAREAHISKLLNLCPYGKPGDRLWVRETFQFVRANSDGQRSTFKAHCKFTVNDYRWIEYAATPRSDEPAPVWKPCIYMPRWASRVTLEITEVRVQRLQEINEEDAKAEGVRCGIEEEIAAESLRGLGRVGASPARISYGELWDSINGQGSWRTNPYVWAITFKKL